MEKEKKAEKNEKVTKRAQRRRLRSVPERTAAVRDKNSTIIDGDKDVR
ncbi:MAG TPA: hypothetical protein VK155_01755 [Bacteroidales bacterium]|nr:hypothetical protein [Bacteroidales bacterium]